MSPHEAKISYYTRHNKCKKILKFLRDNTSGYSKTQLSKELGMHPNTIKKYINDLELLQVIFKNSESNKNLYYLTKGSLV